MAGRHIGRWTRAATLCCVAVVGGCSSAGKDVAPTPLPGSSVRPPLPSDPARAIVAIQISGPSLLAPWSTGQYAAVATRGDGSSDDITASATWSASQAGVIFTTNSRGVMQSGRQGEGKISATLDGVSAEFGVLVLEPGTMKLTGMVMAATGEPLSGVFVKPAPGQPAVLWGFTEESGRYAMYGVTAGLELIAARNGFEPLVRRVRPDEVTIDFVLTPLATPSDVDGTWTMTLSASASCRDNLPPEARERTYAVQFVQRSAALFVTLMAPTLVDLDNPGGPVTGQFDASGGTIVGRNVTFVIVGDTEYGTWSYPLFFDRISASQWLGISAAVHATVNDPSSIDGVMSGDIETWASTSSAVPGGPPSGVCRATDHRVSLRRS